MNRYDASGMTAAKMQEHIDTATSNRRKLLATTYPDIERRGFVRACDIVWGVWPDKGPKSRLGHGLCIVKGLMTMESIAASNRSQPCAITTLWFETFEAAEEACEKDGDDFLLD
ncbi:hypothetical protein AU375_04079 [Methylobacterium radiotolerans]|nr:hypothetical protein AU375_04079 [Methylobacterium radiotolerans]